MTIESVLFSLFVVGVSAVLGHFWGWKSGYKAGRESGASRVFDSLMNILNEADPVLADTFLEVVLHKAIHVSKDTIMRIEGRAE